MKHFNPLAMLATLGEFFSPEAIKRLQSSRPTEREIEEQIRKSRAAAKARPHQPWGILHHYEAQVVPDPDAHPQLHKFTVHGIPIEARSKKEAIKKYALKHQKKQ